MVSVPLWATVNSHCTLELSAHSSSLTGAWASPIISGPKSKDFSSWLVSSQWSTWLHAICWRWTVIARVIVWSVTSSLLQVLARTGLRHNSSTPLCQRLLAWLNHHGRGSAALFISSVLASALVLGMTDFPSPVRGFRRDPPTLDPSFVASIAQYPSPSYAHHRQGSSLQLLASARATSLNCGTPYPVRGWLWLDPTA